MLYELNRRHVFFVYVMARYLLARGLIHAASLLRLLACFYKKASNIKDLQGDMCLTQSCNI